MLEVNTDIGRTVQTHRIVFELYGVQGKATASGLSTNNNKNGRNLFKEWFVFAVRDLFYH